MKKNLHFYYVMFISIICITVTTSSTVFAQSIDDVEDEINKIEKEQKELEKEKSNLDSNKATTETKINENKSKQTTVQEKLQTITNKLNTTQASIDTKESEIEETNKEIKKLNKQVKKLKKEIKQLEKRIKERDKLLKNRLVSIQKNGGNIQYIEVIFGAQNFGDFISRATAVTTIMDQDKLIMEIHTNDKNSLEEKQVAVEDKTEAVEEEKETLEAQKGELVALKSTLDEQKSKQSSLMAQLEEEYEELEEYKLTMEEEAKVMADQAEALEKAKQVAVQQKSELEQLAKKQAEEERARREAEAARKEAAAKEAEKNQNQDTSTPPVVTAPDTNSNGGNFIWPAQGRISSEFGYRVHPIYKTPKLHGGIDIANSTGTDIKAAAPGVVISGYYMSGYGNAVMIAHSINGKSYTTVYAHLNSISVQAGQIVNQGDSIGTMGSTGPSTGPHLHFEIHEGGFVSGGGNRVNPRIYLP